MARVMGHDGSYNAAAITQADVQSITYKVVDANNDHTATASGSLSASDVILDTLNTGDIWTVDSTGFNFSHQLPSTAIDTENHVFIVEYKMTLTDSTVLTWQYQILCKKRYTA